MSGVLNFAESLYLVDGELLQFGTDFELLDFDDLDGNNLVGFLVDSPVDLSELPLPNDIIKDIILYFLPHCLLRFMNRYYYNINYSL